MSLTVGCPICCAAIETWTTTSGLVCRAIQPNEPMRALKELFSATVKKIGALAAPGVKDDVLEGPNGIFLLQGDMAIVKLRDILAAEPELTCLLLEVNLGSELFHGLLIFLSMAGAVKVVNVGDHGANQ